jgi:hypothetical protein
MKFNFRKITSALASTAMVGSTFGVALAANFPAPFVSNGNADVAIVYGNSLDLVAVTDISTALSSALASGSGGTAAGASDDAYPLFTTSTPIQINGSVSSVRTAVTDVNLPSILGDTEFSGNVDAELTHFIYPGSNRVVYAKQPSSDDDPTLGIAMGTSANGNPGYLYNTTVSFDRAVAFNHTDSEGETLTMFGKDFIVSSATDNDELILFRSAESLFLSVGSASSVPSQTVEVDGATYTIELVAASDDSATVKVTDSSGRSDQKEINEAASKKILGLEVAVQSSDESTATNTIQAEILIGANRVNLQDGSTVLIGTDQDPIDNTLVTFTGNIGALTKITISVFADDTSSDALVSGGEVVDPVFDSFRMVFSGTGVEEDDWETFSVGPAGNDKMNIAFSNWQGDDLSSFEWFNNESGSDSNAFLGDSSDWRIFTKEMAAINGSSYAMVGNEDEGYLLKLRTFTNSSSTSAGDDRVVFENVFDSTETWEAQFTSEGVGTINIGGSQYDLTFNKQSSGAFSGENAYVQLNYPDSSGANAMVVYPTVETSKGAKLAFYEPLTIDVGNWTNTVAGNVGGTALGRNLTSILFPDGDGYTTFTVARDPTNQGNFSVNSVLLGNGSGSTILNVGQFKYNVSHSGTSAQPLLTIRLADSTDASSSDLILSPAIMIFEEQDESNNYEGMTIQVNGQGTSSAGVGISEVDFTWNDDNDFSGSDWSLGVQGESNDDLYYKMDQRGTTVVTDESDSDQYSLELMYPDEQVTAMVYLDSLVEGSGSTSLGDVKVMDDELASSGMSSKHLIVVGGSCVNTAAQSLLGGAGCGASWTAATGAGSGEWIIQSFANPWASSKVATLVAGWEQGDTANAATYLTTQNPSTNVGTKLTGTTATAATPVTV